MTVRTPVFVYADDPMSQAGLEQMLRGRPEVRVVASEQIDDAAVAVVGVDEVDRRAAVRAIAGDPARRVPACRGRRQPPRRARRCSPPGEAGALGMLRRTRGVTERARAGRRGASPTARPACRPISSGQLLGAVRRLRRGAVTRPSARRRRCRPASGTCSACSPRASDTPEIAATLSYSERTVKGVIHEVTTRLQLRNRSHAVAFALRNDSSERRRCLRGHGIGPQMCTRGHRHVSRRGTMVGIDAPRTGHRAAGARRARDRRATARSSIDFDAPTKDWASHRNQPTIDIYLYDIRQDLNRYQFGEVARARRRRHGRRAPTDAEVLPPRLPRDGVDAAGRGRAPPPVGADRHVPAPRDACRRELLGGSLAELGIQHPAGRRPAAAPGPGAVGRVVGARRRAQAVARRQPRRPAAARALRRGRAAGARSSRCSTVVDRRRRRRDRRCPPDARRPCPPACWPTGARRRDRSPGHARAVEAAGGGPGDDVLTVSDGGDASLAHVLGRLDVLRLRVAALVARPAGRSTRRPTTRSSGCTSATSASTSCCATTGSGCPLTSRPSRRGRRRARGRLAAAPAPTLRLRTLGAALRARRARRRAARWRRWRPTSTTASSATTATSTTT